MYWAGKYIYAKGGLASNLEWIQKPDAGALAWFFVDLAGFGDFPSIGRQAVTGLALLVLAAGYAAWRERARLHTGHFVYMARFLLYFVLGSVAVAFHRFAVAAELGVGPSPHGVPGVSRCCMLVAAAYFQLNSPAGADHRRSPVRSLGRHGDSAPPARATTRRLPSTRWSFRCSRKKPITRLRVTFYSVDKYLHYPIWFYLETLKAGKITGFARPHPHGRSRQAGGRSGANRGQEPRQSSKRRGERISGWDTVPRGRRNCLPRRS